MHLCVCWFLGCLVPGPSPFSSGNTGPFLTCRWWRLPKAGVTFSPARFRLLRVSLSGLRAVVKRTSPNTVLRKITPLWFWFRWALSVHSFSVHTSFREQLVSRWCYAAEVLVPFYSMNWKQAKGIAAMRQLTIVFHIESSTGYKSKYGILKILKLPTQMPQLDSVWKKISFPGLLCTWFWHSGRLFLRDTVKTFGCFCIAASLLRIIFR